MDNKAVLPTTRFLSSFMHFWPAGMLVLISFAFEGRHPRLLVRGLSVLMFGEAANLARLGAWQASITTWKQQHDHSQTHFIFATIA